MLTQKQAAEKIEVLFEKWIEKDFQSFPGLLGVLQFGSTVRSPVKFETDLDLLLIFDSLPSSRYDRFTLTRQLEDCLNEDLKSLQGFHIEVSFILQESSNLIAMKPYYLDFPACSKVRYDPLNILANLLKDIQEWMDFHGSKRIDQGALWYWIYDTKHGKNEPVSFDFINKRIK